MKYIHFQFNLPNISNSNTNFQNFIGCQYSLYQNYENKACALKNFWIIIILKENNGKKFKEKANLRICFCNLRKLNLKWIYFKILKIFQNFQNISKFQKYFKILKIFQNFKNVDSLKVWIIDLNNKNKNKKGRDRQYFASTL